MQFISLPHWLREYKQTDFRFDLLAGLTVGVMLIPQGMAYAMLAGLPPVYGLYASTIPLIIYALLGTSRHLSVGPVAIDSILIAAGLSVIAQAGSDEYISLAITLAFMVGAIQFSFGISRLGFLIHFLSHPVIQGFTSAAAIIIGLSQLKHLLGIDIAGNQYLQTIIVSLAEGGYKIHILTFTIGIGCILLLLLIKRYLPSWPGPLILVVITTLLVYFLKLDSYGVDIIGAIPQGLPAFGLPQIDFPILKQLLAPAFAIALVSFMGSNAVARSIQAKHKTYRVVPNRELIALGMANIAGSFFKSFPVSGGLSRSIVNDHAGARTGMSSLITAFLVVLTLLFLTPLFYYLPSVVLASIIITAVYKLVNINEAKYLWQLDRKDFLMMLVTFLGTLFFGIGTGIGIGVLLSLAWIIFEASYPHYAELGRIPGTHSYRNIRRFDKLLIDEDILIFRFDAPLFFANIERFRQILYEYKTLRKGKLRAIIIDMESINSVDSSAINTLTDIMNEIHQENIMLLLTEVKGPVRDKFHKSGLTKKLEENNFFVAIEDAVDFVSGTKKEFITGIAIQTNVGDKNVRE